MTRNRKTPRWRSARRELNSMTAELDMLHKETFPGVHKTLDEFSANLAHLTASRPHGVRFLLGMGGAVAVGTRRGVLQLEERASGTTAGSTPAPDGATYTGDLKVVALAAALENLAVTAYQGALTMAGKGQFGAVPPAVATFVTDAMAQHKDHARRGTPSEVRRASP